MSLHICLHHLLHPTFHKLLTKLRRSRSFNSSPSSRACSTHKSPKLRFAGLQLCLALQSSHCHHRFTSLPAVGTALLLSVGTTLSSRIFFGVPTLAVFLSRILVPTLAVFLQIITQTSPLTAIRNPCRPRHNS